MRQRCARILAARRRLITFAPGLGICSGQVDMRVRYLGRGKNVSDGRSGLVSSLRCLLENGNSNKFSQYSFFFCQNSVFAKIEAKFF